MSFLKGLNKDYYGGVVMIVAGLCAAYVGSGYRLGTLSRMGPGFFPTSLGILLTAVGAAIAIGASLATTVKRADFSFDLRGCGAILGGLIAFVLVGRSGGLALATFALVFISAIGDRSNTFKQAVWLALAMVAIAIVVFHWALGLQLRLFPWT